MQARERHAGAARDERPSPGRVHDHPEELAEDEDEPGGDERGPRPDEGLDVEGDPRGEQERARQQRQRHLQAPRMAGVVAEHHRDEVKRRARDRHCQHTEGEQMDGEDRRACQRLGGGNVGRCDHERDRGRQPAGQRDRDVRGEQAERDRPADGPPAAGQRQRLRPGTAAKRLIGHRNSSIQLPSF